ncbi:MAG: FAD:protein FMN transferase [Microscillaceae bacterium]|nr:FAD:protein FMN transferase [Microscillaceae bacterium]
MNNRQKNIAYSLVLLSLVGLVYLYRLYTSPTPEAPASGQKTLRHLKGITMGVVAYNVKYLDAENRDFQAEIDTLLKSFNRSLSTYDPASEISRFNQDRAPFTFESSFFYPVVARSREIYEITAGAFDPTVAPLVNAWGFGFKKQVLPSPAQVDSLRKLIGYAKITFDQKQIRKNQPGVMLDFSAIAKGYGVDCVAKLLESKGIQNFMVEIGGEVVAKGVNEEGKAWVLGITHPRYKQPGQPSLFKTVMLQNRAMATSGNYENYYIKDGKKYVHTIDPTTGYPVEHSLKSASVFAPDCMTADAYATAFMVMGVERTKTVLKKIKDVDVFLIYEDERGNLQSFASAGIAAQVKEVPL